MFGLGWEAINSRDWLGNPLETPQQWAHWAIVEHLVPIWLQGALPSPSEPGAGVGGMLAELAGMRAYPIEEYVMLGDKYAQAKYGKKWGELYPKDKTGKVDTSTLSAYQKILMSQHKDLRDAYATYKKQRAARYKEVHELPVPTK